MLIGLICDSLLKAAQHSLGFSQKIRNPIIYYILIRLVFTPGKPQTWGCFSDTAVGATEPLIGFLLISCNGTLSFVVLFWGEGKDLENVLSPVCEISLSEMYKLI